MEINEGLFGVGSMPLLSGFKIIESSFMVEDGDPYEKRRTWKERLFSMPWKPFKKTKTVIPKVPMRKVFRMKDNTIIMHPVIAAELRRQIDIDR